MKNLVAKTRATVGHSKLGGNKIAERSPNAPVCSISYTPTSRTPPPTAASACASMKTECWKRTWMVIVPISRRGTSEYHISEHIPSPPQRRQSVVKRNIIYT
jgi:hypothetical protein